MEITKAKLSALASKERDFTAAILTDMHLTDAENASFAALLEVLKLADSTLGLDAVIDLGDNLGMLGRNFHSSNAEIIEILDKIHAKLAANSSAPILSINGNHDAVGTDFFKLELWNAAVGDKFNAGIARHAETPEGKSAYYYVDFDAYKLRAISLSTPWSSDLEAEMPTPLWEIGAAQLDWLESTALAIPAEWRVAIFMHVPANSVYEGDMEKTLDVWTGTRAAKSRIADLCGWLEDRPRFEAILTAFAAKNPGSLTAAISGHNHVDQLFLPGDGEGSELNRLPCPQINLPAAFNPRLGSEYKFAFDILTLSGGRLELTRLGNGSDRDVELAR